MTSRADVGSSAISSFGRADKPDRDERALTHTARELVRVLIDPLLGVAEACLARAARLPERARRLALGDAVGDQGLVDLEADLPHRVQVRHRVLRNEADLAAADVDEVLLLGLRRVTALEQDAPRRHRAGAGKQVDDRVRGGRLTGTGFADDRNGLPRVDRQRYAANGRDRTGVGPETADLEILRDVVAGGLGVHCDPCWDRVIASSPSGRGRRAGRHPS